VNNAPDGFLLTPEHEGKPRLHSVTHALDLAMPTELLAAYLASAGAFVDVMKLGWGLGYIDPQLSQRAQLCRRHGVILSAGSVRTRTWAMSGSRTRWPSRPSGWA